MTNKSFVMIPTPNYQFIDLSGGIRPKPKDKKTVLSSFNEFMLSQSISSQSVVLNSKFPVINEYGNVVNVPHKVEMKKPSLNRDVSNGVLPSNRPNAWSEENTYRKREIQISEESSTTLQEASKELVTMEN